MFAKSHPQVMFCWFVATSYLTSIILYSFCSTPEADLLRSFLNLPEGVRQRESTIHPSVSVDKESCISSCILGSDK